MKKARMLIIGIGISTKLCLASEHTETNAHQTAGEPGNPVVALFEPTGNAISLEQLLTVKEHSEKLIDRKKMRVELAPYAVGMFNRAEKFQLMRGSAILQSSAEQDLLTNSASVQFTGKIILSYDFKEKSTSVFVLEGQARLMNPMDKEKTLRVDPMQGASLVVGDVLPQMKRQLDFASVDAWMKGFSWSAESRAAITKLLPKENSEIAHHSPEHLAENKLTDYFAAVEPGDDKNQPDYYKKKFADPDETIAGKKERVASPEEAAMIDLPSTKLDLGFSLFPEIVTAEQKSSEVEHLNQGTKKAPARQIASLPKAKKVEKVAEAPRDEVSETIERIRRARNKPAGVSTRQPARAPSSVSSSAVADPVSDYSQNF